MGCRVYGSEGSRLKGYSGGFLGGGEGGRGREGGQRRGRTGDRFFWPGPPVVDLYSVAADVPGPGVIWSQVAGADA